MKIHSISLKRVLLCSAAVPSQAVNSLRQNDTVVSFFTVTNVTANYTGNYSCVVSNLRLDTLLTQTDVETVIVTVFCKHMYVSLRY